MNLRWLWLDHFPAGLDLSPAQRQEARRRARLIRAADPTLAGARRRAARLVTFWSIALSAAFVVWVLRSYWLPWKARTGTGTVLLAVFTPLVFNAMIWIAIAMSINRAAAPFVRAALSSMGFPTCVPCGYLLKGIAVGQPCPECGTVPTSVIVPEMDAGGRRLRML